MWKIEILPLFKDTGSWFALAASQAGSAATDLTAEREPDTSLEAIGLRGSSE